MNNQFVMLETQSAVHAFTQASQHYALFPIKVAVEDSAMGSTPNYAGGEIRPLSKPRALDMVKNLIDECISQCVRYKMPFSATDQIASILTDNAIPTPRDITLAENFLTDPMVDGAVVELANQVRRYVSATPWQQWDVVASRSSIALVGTKDYRIAEWERYTAFDSDNEAVSVDVRTIANYLRQSLEFHYGKLAGQVSVSMLIRDAVCRRHPEVNTGRGLIPATEEFMQCLGHQGYMGFCEQFVDPVIADFDMMFLKPLIKRGRRYSVELSNNFTLVLNPLEMSNHERSLQHAELRESAERGDYLPPSERRRLEEYERYC